MDLENANGLSTPFVKEDKDVEDEKLSQEAIMAYRNVTASGNYLGHDRPDVQLAIKQRSKPMPSPTTASWEMMKKVGRYLKVNSRAEQLFRRQT